MLYPIAISMGDDEHAWGVEVPDIPGCFSAGDDLDGAPIPPANKVTLHAANPQYAGCTWAVVDIDITKYLGKAQKLNITLPGYLLTRIDEYVLHHPEEKSRSGFLASAALKVLQQG
ncbi:MAG: type II toxin-antitoxin system HicB family antitoxin [Pseudomonas sp.]|nr:type II toxin-antitoxin system HicB family antitoxin [Pseudomonas sp.]